MSKWTLLTTKQIIQKKTIQDCHNIANSRNGKCLSTKYINSTTKYLWECQYKHQWKATYGSIQQGSWCPECANSKKKTIQDCHDIANSKNGKCLSTEYINNKTKMLWECEYEHQWEATYDSVGNDKSWCPKCAGNVKFTIQDCHKAAQKQNGKCLSTKYINSTTKYLWECQHGHQWVATYNNIKQKDCWCLTCAGKEKKSIQDCYELAKSKNGKCLSTEYINIHTKYLWQCQHSHQWEATYSSIQQGSWCPKCAGLIKTTVGSSIEIIAKQKLNKIGLNIQDYNKEVPKLQQKGYKYRPDLICIDNNNNKIYIDIDGLYWHSEYNKDKNYHIDKQKTFNKYNIRYMQIREDELNDNKINIIAGLLKAQTKINTRIYARKTIFKIVKPKDAQEFLQENHLMGKFNSAKHIGLYYKDELVMLLSYKKYKNYLDISRLCTKVGYTIIGGLSKLLSKINTTNIDFIQSFVDLRYANGNSLIKLGFKYIKTTLGWKWTDGKNTYNRLQCRANMDERNLSEKEYAAELKWYKIYDAGQAKFTKTV